MTGTSADVMIWDQRGLSQPHGQFSDFELGAHDGAYKGRLQTAVLYMGRKTLSEDQQEYNDVHGFYRGKGGAPLCTVVAMDDCPQCLDTL